MPAMIPLSLAMAHADSVFVPGTAAKEEISGNQFIMLAIAEKLASTDTAEYLKKRAERGSRERLLEILAKAPNVDPEPEDRLWLRKQP